MEQGSCFARMLDIRSYILAARMSLQRADATMAVTMIIVFAILGLVLTPIYVGYDLHSTWDWAAGTKAGAEDAVTTITEKIEDAAPADARLFDMTIGQIVGALLVVGITLLPTLFELAFPMLRHPLLMILLTAAILFDYVTDWNASWAATEGWSGAGNWFLHVLWTVLFNLFVSVGVQAILVVCATVIIFGFLRLIGGAAPAALGEAVIMRKG